MPTHADTVRAMPARRPRKPGPKKGAANAGRPERPGQAVLQLRASAAAVAAFDTACEDVYHACRSDVLRWLLEDLAAGLVRLCETHLGRAKAALSELQALRLASDAELTLDIAGIDVVCDLRSRDVAAKLNDYPQEVADAYLTGMVREMADSLANQSNLGGLADAAQKIVKLVA